MLNPTSNAQWGLQFDGREGTFYPIYLVIDGAVQEQGALLSSEAERIIQKIDRYDYDAHGNYVVRGLVPKLVYFTDFETQYLVEHGLAHIAGKEVHQYFDLKPTFPNEPDLYLTEREAHDIVKNGDGSVDIIVYNEPLDNVLEVSAPIRSTLMRTKTSSSREQLPITAVLDLVSVDVGGTSYMDQVTLDGDDLVWGAGAPAVGTTYFVVIDHTVKLEVVNPIHDSVTRTGFKILEIL